MSLHDRFKTYSIYSKTRWKVLLVCTAQFFAEVLQCEYEMTHATYRMQKDLSEEFAKRPVNYAALFAIMQVICRLCQDITMLTLCVVGVEGGAAG